MMERGELRQRAYALRLEIAQLRLGLAEELGPDGDVGPWAALDAAERRLSQVERDYAAASAPSSDRHGPPGGYGPPDWQGAPESMPVMRGGPGTRTARGRHSTGLRATVSLRMTQVPTSVYHLFDVAKRPLISCRVENADDAGQIRRVRVSSFIEGYSARAVETFELSAGQTRTFDQLPTLFPQRIRRLSELSTATLNLLVEDLDTGKVEIHVTRPVRLLPRTTVPLAIRDPKTQAWMDLGPYLGAYVTPNAPEIMRFLREAANHHPTRALSGYQGRNEEAEAQVEAQVEAVYAALQHTKITYVNSLVAFSGDEDIVAQRVRLPRESLNHREANCIDGTVLFASLLEAISMNPAIVVVPSHAFVAWETRPGSDVWRYLETTMIGSKPFERARSHAERAAQHYQRLLANTGDDSKFRRWALRSLRAEHQIMPME